jgi:N6-L-threonylcarbamoyladenine synthase
MITSGDLNFSFSGLKTSVLTRIRSLGTFDEATRADLAASFQAAIVDVLAAKCALALDREALQRLVVAGGVGANSQLRERLVTEAAQRGARVYFPPLRLCTDNGAMIAFAAALKHPHGVAEGQSGFPVFPRWDLAKAARGTETAARNG